MKNEEIKNLSTAELTEKIEVEVANYNQMLLNHSVSPVENSASIKQMRRGIAQLKTELRQRELSK
ncbi:MAG: 50S ribosomal protein L29 [Bacteroidaceae bacterium]|nr:50S ribosomal protein L29 [Bacteroidaceae bacterium]